MKEQLGLFLKDFKMGDVTDFSTMINAVIDKTSFINITNYIENAKKSPDAEIIFGGTYDASKGYFITPTIILAKKPDYVTMCEEIFGPVLTVYIYSDEKYEETLQLCNKTSPYALTGSIFAKDRIAINTALKYLKHAAGNFYINDKCTGAVVGQQPFGGSRASGTNDKAGSKLNLIRWISVRAIKENFIPPKHPAYPYMAEP
jgi:1-pyrroline-5-carboxylate dehydrogenase